MPLKENSGKSLKKRVMAPEIADFSLVERVTEPYSIGEVFHCGLSSPLLNVRKRQSSMTKYRENASFGCVTMMAFLP